MVVASKANVCVRCTTPDRTTSQCFTEAFCRENRPGNLLVRVHPGHPEYDCVRVPANGRNKSVIHVQAGVIYLTKSESKK